MVVVVLASTLAFVLLAARRFHLLAHSLPVRGQDALWGIVYGVTGWVIATRRPRNPIGWIFILIGLSASVSAFAGALQTDLPMGPAQPWGADVGTWLQQWVWAPFYVLVTTFLLLLFPDGTLPSLRFRWVQVVASTALGAMVLGGILSPDNNGEPGFHNPLVVLPRWIDLLDLVGLMLFVVATLGSVVALIVRFRGSSGVERLQLKWFVYGAIATVCLYGGLSYRVEANTPVLQIIGYLAAPLLPGACLVAVLRYRLYEIDRIINRTLVYGLLTALLVALYSVLVVGLATLVGSVHPIVIAASTLAVATAFGPARRWAQGFIDRRFYRRKYDAEGEIRRFSETLGSEVELDALQSSVLSLIGRTMRPAMASLWLGDPGDAGHDHDSSIASPNRRATHPAPP